MRYLLLLAVIGIGIFTAINLEPQAAVEPLPMSIPEQALVLENLVVPEPAAPTVDTFLEDSGASLYAVVGKIDPSTQLRDVRQESDLRVVLEQTNSIGLGLRGEAKLGGETFSWDNVNLENISYG
jgi:hypothetical protein